MNILVLLQLSSGDTLHYVKEISADSGYRDCPTVEEAASLYAALLASQLNEPVLTLPTNTFQGSKPVYTNEIVIKVNTKHVVYFSIASANGIRQAHGAI